MKTLLNLVIVGPCYFSSEVGHIAGGNGQQNERPYFCWTPVSLAIADLVITPPKKHSNFLFIVVVPPPKMKKWWVCPFNRQWKLTLWKHPPVFVASNKNNNNKKSYLYEIACRERAIVSCASWTRKGSIYYTTRKVEWRGNTLFVSMEWERFSFFTKRSRSVRSWMNENGSPR